MTLDGGTPSIGARKASVPDRKGSIPAPRRSSSLPSLVRPIGDDRVAAGYRARVVPRRDAGAAVPQPSCCLQNPVTLRYLRGTRSPEAVLRDADQPDPATGRVEAPVQAPVANRTAGW